MGNQGKTNYCLSIIKDYGSVEATLPFPQYGSQTVKIHALFISCLVDAIEDRRVTITDIPGAFLSVDWPLSATPCYL